MGLPEKPKNEVNKPREIFEAFAANITPQMSTYLTKLATFTARQTQMPANIRMGLIEDFDDLNQRNIFTMIYCFEAMHLDELEKHKEDKQFCTNMFVGFCFEMDRKRAKELIIQ